jgi:thiamine-monophosphate kinase
VTSTSGILSEFEQIAQLMAPLTEQVEGAFALSDDAAVFSHAPHEEIVVTTDTLIADVHFFAGDNPRDVAHKLLGVNLSDLAAMGARPLHYTLNASYPANITTEWIADFAHGLDLMQKKYGIRLLGGDTTRTKGPLVLSLCAFGLIDKGMCLRRNGAGAGDLICVSGTIGDGALGLKAAKGELIDETGHLLNRYLRPQPRVQLGQALIGQATSCMDISDGLLGDLNHLLKQSACGADLEFDRIPLSDAARNNLLKDSSLITTVLNGGDDYELLFTIPKEKEKKLLDISRQSETKLHVIGSISTHLGLRLHQEDGHLMNIATHSYRHF